MRLSPENALELLNLRLQAKYREVEKSETAWESVAAEDAEYLLIGFGLSARICKSAVNVLRKAGMKAGLFRPITLWPFPSAPLAAAARGKKKLLVVEMNAGQMLQDVRLSVEGAPVDFFGTLGSATPQVDAIVERITGYAG
jgi:2-oxoglutarate ferredoxin oxidoreductase subunit alpha